MKRRIASISQDLLQRERFRHEPVYCESPHNPDDVLCHGSDDDAYDDPIERQLRIEHQANRFLHGLPMFIASAQIQRTFEGEHAWQTTWRLQNSITQTGQNPGHPHKRLKQSGKENTRSKDSLSRPSAGSDVSSDQGSRRGHEYLSSASLCRIKSWRDGVVKVARTDNAHHGSPPPPLSPARTRRSPQVIGDSFDTSRVVQPSFTHVAGPRLPQEPEPAHSKRAVSTLRNYSSLATTPRTQSPVHMEPEPTPVRTLNETAVNHASSSDLSDLSQPTPEPPRRETQPEAALDSSQKVAEPEKKERAVAVKGRPSAVRVREFSDRSFLFRGVGSRRGPASELPTDRAVNHAEATASRGEHNTTEPDHAPTSDETIPQNNNPETSIVTEPNDRTRVESSTDSIVAANKIAEPEPEPQQVDTVEADTTHVACLDAFGDASMIDGPTLIPSMSKSDSTLSDLESMGNFSCEKQSQALPREMAQLPRKLLWPKSDKGTADTSLGSDSEAPDAKATTNRQRTKEGDGVDPSDEEEVVVGKATSADACSNPTDDEEDEANMDGGCTTLGTPLPNRDEEQSPWRNSQIEVKREEPDTEEHIDIEAQSPLIVKAPPESKVQSPWARESSQPAVALEAPEQPELPPVERDEQTSQSPWATGDSQLAAAIIPDSRLFQPLSSPAKSDKSPLREIALPNLPAPSRSQGDMPENQEPCPQRPSTPEFQSSSLPTPEHTDSGIKSFREFLTPSPQKSKRSRKRRISALNDGQFPSTQALEDAAVSNPWLDPAGQRLCKKRQKLRVSWAPLPGKEDESSIAMTEDASTQSPAGAEFPDEPRLSSSIRLRPRSILRSSRASSPPPSSLPKHLPAEKEKFGKHFAAVASRRAGNQNRPKAAILPSASQQTIDSPPISAMAERFLAAEEVSSLSSRPRAISVLSEGEVYERGRQHLKSLFVMDRHSSSQLSTPLKSVQILNDDDDGDSEVELSPGEVIIVEEEEEEQESIDPVKDVMQNLNSFLDDTWELRTREDSGIGGEPASISSRRRRTLRSSQVMDTPTNIWR